MSLEFGFCTLYITAGDWMCALETVCLPVPDATLQSQERQVGIQKKIH